MLLTCPYCGPRDVSEFTYQGDGNRTRPDPASTDSQAWGEYVYDRVNIAGDQNEIWQHSGGCRSHLNVRRDTLTHKVSSIAFMRRTETEKAPYVRKAPAQAPAKRKPAAKKAPK